MKRVRESKHCLNSNWRAIFANVNNDELPRFQNNFFCAHVSIVFHKIVFNNLVNIKMKTENDKTNKKREKQKKA